MAASIIDGKACAQAVEAEVAEEVARFSQDFGRTPRLTVILCGDDAASASYVRGKTKASTRVGIRSETLGLPASTTEAQLLDEVRKCNADPDVDAVLIQLPLPEQIDEATVIAAVDPKKDVDGFHPFNFGLLAAGKPDIAPCTPVGCMELLRRNGIAIAGSRAVVIGRSLIVGRPMAYLLTAADATVTVCHSKTKDIQASSREADILVVAIGKPKMVDKSYIKPGAAVIDVGINRVGDQLVGDVDLDSASQVAGWITPVPGGVGPMTIACLLRNTLTLAKRRAQATS